MKKLRIALLIAAGLIAIEYVAEKIIEKRKKEEDITDIMLLKGLRQRDSVSAEMIRSYREKRDNPWAGINMYDQENL